MKKMFVIISYLLLILFNISCNDFKAPRTEVRFAIFLLKNNTLTTSDIEGKPINTFELNDNPFISYEDIVGYNSKIHKMYLKKKLSDCLGPDSLKVFSEYRGKPFIVVALGERIYNGSFLNGVLSHAPITPLIVDYDVNNAERSVLISSAPHYNESTFIDVRNDERILYALRDKIIK